MLSFEVGLGILIGIFLLAAVCFSARVRAARASEERLRSLGFEPCDEEAPALLATYTRLARGHRAGDAPRFEIARCLRKPAGSGCVYRFRATEPSAVRGSADERPAVAPVSDVFLLDVRDGEVRRPCSLFLSFTRGGVLHAVLARTIAAQPLGAPLELPHASREAFLAAFGAERGRLDEHLAPAALERLTRASAAGFYAVHFAPGEAAFVAPEGARDADALWNHLADWL